MWGIYRNVLRSHYMKFPESPPLIAAWQLVEYLILAVPAGLMPEYLLVFVSHTSRGCDQHPHVHSCICIVSLGPSYLYSATVSFAWFVTHDQKSLNSAIPTASLAMVAPFLSVCCTRILTVAVAGDQCIGHGTKSLSIATMPIHQYEQHYLEMPPHEEPWLCHTFVTLALHIDG